MIWGIITTYRGLIFRTRIILMTPTHISIHEIFRGSKKIYDIGDLKKISAGTAYDMGVYSKGIKVEFKNGDKYELIFYDYLNFGRIELAFGKLRKIYEESLI